MMAASSVESVDHKSSLAMNVCHSHENRKPRLKSHLISDSEKLTRNYCKETEDTLVAEPHFFSFDDENQNIFSDLRYGSDTRIRAYSNQKSRSISESKAMHTITPTFPATLQSMDKSEEVIASQRKSSIEMFLSQSPSQSLGSHFLQLNLKEPELRANRVVQLQKESLQPEISVSKSESYVNSFFNSKTPSDAFEYDTSHDSSGMEKEDIEFHVPFEEDTNVLLAQEQRPSLPLYPVPWHPYATYTPSAYDPSQGIANEYGVQIPRMTAIENGYNPIPLYPSRPVSASSPKYCKYFVQGHCRLGNKCRFFHAIPNEVYRVHSAPPPLPIPRPNHFYTKHATSMENSVNHTIFDTHALCYCLRPEDFIHRVFIMSKDQNGCRLLQEQLEQKRHELCDIIYQESFSHLIEMMVDPFGNYLFQKLFEHVSLDKRLEMLESISRHLMAAALNLHGTRSVQKVIEICAACPNVTDGTQIVYLPQMIVQALEEDAVRLCIDSNGNHVIQRTLQFFESTYTQFIFDAIEKECTTIGTHRHGCCVLQRCLDAASYLQKRSLIAQVEQYALKLMQDPYGNYVVQYILDTCDSEEIAGLVEIPLGHVFELSIQKFSSNVVEKCLEKAPEKIRSLYIKELIENEQMGQLLQDQFANYVIQRALCVCDEWECVQFMNAMSPYVGNMKSYSNGRRILARIMKRFPHLNLNMMEQTSEEEPEEWMQ